MTHSPQPRLTNIIAIIVISDIPPLGFVVKQYLSFVAVSAAAAAAVVVLSNPLDRIASHRNSSIRLSCGKHTTNLFPTVLYIAYLVTEKQQKTTHKKRRKKETTDNKNNNNNIWQRPQRTVIIDNKQDMPSKAALTSNGAIERAQSVVYTKNEVRRFRVRGDQWPTTE